MRIGGKKIDSKPASEMLVFPRENGDIAIRANAIMDKLDFDRLVKPPTPPKKRIKGGSLVDNTEDPRYLAAISTHGGKYINWLVIQSLCGVNKETQEDEPIEWEQVDKQDPTTWDKWEDELKLSGFSEMERKRIHNLVITVNSLSESRLEEARNSFLLPPEEDQPQLSSPIIEQSGTQSGELVRDSE